MNNEKIDALPEFDDKYITKPIKENIEDSPNLVDKDISTAYSFKQPIFQKRIRFGCALFCIVIACVTSFMLGYFYFEDFVMKCY